MTTIAQTQTQPFGGQPFKRARKLARKFGAFMAFKRELRFVLSLDERSFADTGADRSEVHRLLRMSFKQYCEL